MALSPIYINSFYQNATDSNYLYISWTKPSGTTDFELVIQDGNTATVYLDTYVSGDTTDYYFYVSSPQWNVSNAYAVKVNAIDTVNSQYSGWSSYSYATMYTSPPSTPTITSIVQSGTTLSHTVYFSKDSKTTNVNISITGKGTYYNIYGTSYTFTAADYSRFGVNIQANDSIGRTSSWSAVTYFTPTPPRPTNFTGNLYKVDSGGNDVVDIAQWVAFATKVNLFRTYKNLSQYGYSYLNYAQVGNIFKAIYFNEMMDSMSMCTGLPIAQSVGNNVYKSYFDTLVTRLNAL